METNSITKVIIVLGEACQVTAHKKGRMTWIAFGNFHDKRIESVAAKSYEQAFSYWEKKARMIADNF